MFHYFLKRFLLVIPTMFLVVSIVFFLMRLAPGDPVDFILGESALPEARTELIQSYHFDKPLFEQYLLFLKDAVKGDFGESIFSRTAVTTLISERYGATVFLATTAILWALLFSIPLGVISAVKQSSITDKSLLVFSLVGISVPSFFLGPLLALLFSIKLDWFPISGNELPGSFFLPSITLGLALAAILTRITRASLLEVLHRDYIRTAKAKGLNRIKVIVKHGLRTALIPVVAILGLQFGTLLAGAVVTEKIFSWPGLGSLLLQGLSQRDYAVVQACILLIALTYVVINLFTDVIYVFIDPRMRKLSEGGKK